MRGGSAAFEVGRGVETEPLRFARQALLFLIIMRWLPHSDPASCVDDGYVSPRNPRVWRS